MAVLALSASSAHAETDLTFVAPEGFHAISEDQLPMLGAISAAAPRAKRALAVADERDGALRAVMIAMVVPVHDGEHVALPSLRELEQELTRNATTNAAKRGVTIGSRDARMIKVRGVDAIRISSTASTADREEHHVVYYLPGNGQLAIVTCISTVDAERYGQLFQAAVGRTLGLQQPAWWAKPMNKLRSLSAERLWIVLPVLLLGYLSFRRKSRRHREAVDPPARR